jgi:hypothetical protein
MTKISPPLRPHKNGPLFVSWGAISGRAEEISHAVGGSPLCCFPPGASYGLPAPIRWLFAIALTITRLLRDNPPAVIVTNPPVFAALTVFAWARVLRRPVVLDDHPGSFGTHGDRVAARMLWVHRRLVPRAAACLVTSEKWCELIRTWGGHPIVLHESPLAWLPDAPQPAPMQMGDDGSARVLLSSTFSKDEPIACAVEAAARVSEVTFVVTGDRSRHGGKEDLREAPNVRYMGFLPFEEYRRVVLWADVVVALTTEPTSAMRSAFEAVWARKMLVVSDWPLLRELFPHAVFVKNTEHDIEQALHTVQTADRTLFRAIADEAYDRQLDSWERQLASLRDALPRPD